MQAEMQAQQKGSGNCSKPGNGKPKPGSMSTGDMKEMLKKQLEKLKKGSSPGDGKEGDKPGEKPGDKPGMGKCRRIGVDCALPSAVSHV